MSKKFSNYRLLSFLFTLFVLSSSLPGTGYSQTPARTYSAADLKARLSSIEEKAEKRRKELGIPGMSLAIVKDNKVIYSKGLGVKNFEQKIAMTADTQMPIGSATKAFTGLSVLISEDEGKLSLDDSPKKYLPYFKINNPDTDKKIQIRDLMSHSSGLNRTDLAMVTGKLNRVELITVAGEAKPMAGLREKFFYQNLMFVAAGEIVARVQKKPWEETVRQKIFAPLGMNNSSVSIDGMQKSMDYSLGYSFNFDTKKTRRLPFRKINEIAPAGSINSSANDMARWLRFILNGGVLDGKRIVSENGFKEWLKPQMKISPTGNNSYALGWFLQEWNGKKVVHHGGSIDGFNSMVAMIPEENLGFVMLTNVSASSLGNELMQIVWSGILEDTTNDPLTADAKKEIGKYKFVAAGFDIDVLIEDGKLVAKVPGQPTYILENVEGRKYKLSNAPPGFFITFKDSEAFLEQPQGNYTLPKAGAETSGDDSARALIGTYESSQTEGSTVEIKEVDGKPSLLVGSQPPYALVKRSETSFGFLTLPDTYYLNVDRGENGQIAGFTMVQPEGEFGFKYLGNGSSAEKAEISVDELMQRIVDAAGGEKAIRRLTSRVMKFELDAVNQGVKGYGTIYKMAPDKSATYTVLTALGKKIGWINEYFDGKIGSQELSFADGQEYTGKRLADLKVENDFYVFFDRDKKLEKAVIERVGKVGGKEAYVVSIYPKNASKYTMYYSKENYLPLKKVAVVHSSTSSQTLIISEEYADYRNIDGVMLAFKITADQPGMGEIITSITEVKHNVKISESIFRKD